MYRIDIATSASGLSGISLKTDDLVGALRLASQNKRVVGISLISNNLALDGTSVWPENHTGCAAFPKELQEEILKALG